MTKILLVEDDKSLREIYGTRLLAENFDIVSAGDGEEALALAIKEKPELIISDVMMPKISGFDMLDILRSTTETRDIKVIMMTALSSDDQRTRGEQLGADKYLVKSQVGIEDVVAAVHQVLGDGGATSPPPTPASDANPADATAAPADASAASDSATPDDGSAASPVASGSAPGNDAAGPLPPQPSEIKPPVESTEPAEEPSLPQPTAPFSSPRPANLGEDVLHAAGSTDASVASETTTPPAPDFSTPDSPSSTEPSAAPASSDPAGTPAPEGSGLGLGLESPSDPSAAPVVSPAPSGDTSVPVTPETPATPGVTPDLTPPSEEKNDETTPTVGPATPAV